MLAGSLWTVAHLKVNKKRREKEDGGTYVGRVKDAGKGRRGVATVIESERAPGTTGEVNPSILDIEPTQVSPPQQ